MRACSTLITTSAERTAEIGARLGDRAGPGMVFDLRGTLGAGKTQFVRGLARGLGIEDGVRSPTYTIHQMFKGRHTLHHVDAYRLEEPGELLLMGWDEMCEGGVVAVEWGERIAELLPEERITVILEHAGVDRRRLRFAAHGDLPVELLEGLTGESGAAPEGDHE